MGVPPVLVLPFLRPGVVQGVRGRQVDVPVPLLVTWVFFVVDAFCVPTDVPAETPEFRVVLVRMGCRGVVETDGGASTTVGVWSRRSETDRDGRPSLYGEEVEDIT